MKYLVYFSPVDLEHTKSDPGQVWKHTTVSSFPVGLKQKKG